MIARFMIHAAFGALTLCATLPAATADARPSPRLRATAGAVQKHLGIYLTTAPLRDTAERIRLQQKDIEIWFLRPVKPAQRTQALCEGARWLLTGRLAETTGVGAFFADRSELDQVTLVFYDMVTSLEMQRSGKYDQKRTPTPDMRFTISREKAAALDPVALSNTLTGRRCESVARSVLDAVWVRGE